MSAEHEPYELVVRSQNGAEELLRALGALKELEEAVLGHCEANRPAPLYRPQEYKRRLAEHGWLPEARVPPFRSDFDDLPINERYDALKFFRDGAREVGVALEIEGWQINNDLLKFRRGLERGQIDAAVILQPDYATLSYCFEHVRHINEPLTEHIPILFLCARGPGLDEGKPPSNRALSPYLYPRKFIS